MMNNGARLPRKLVMQLERIQSDWVVVAAVRTVTNQDCGSFAALGLKLEDGRINGSEPLLPAPTEGKYARRNLEGWDEKLLDRPKENREISHWAPSWNSGSFHLVSRTIKAYPVLHHPAKLLTISTTLLEHLVDAAIVRFRVDQPLNRHDRGFTADLLFNIGLLREAAGEARAYDADLTDAEFAAIQRVDWELLPPGSAERILVRLATRGFVCSKRLKVTEERLRVLDRLGPEGFIVGTGQFARYFGAKFGSRVVALENLEYGNALYVFEADWEQLSQLSRSELIRRRDPGVHRIPHLPGWGSAIRKILRS